jgi:hypothetical protein
MSVHLSETRTVKGTCPQDCPDTCSMIYHVEDGKLVEVTGNPEHPMTRGGLCVKLKDFAEHHYNPNRLLYPMKRTGLKGSGQFERIRGGISTSRSTSRRSRPRASACPTPSCSAGWPRPWGSQIASGR